MNSRRLFIILILLVNAVFVVAGEIDGRTEKIEVDAYFRQAGEYGNSLDRLAHSLAFELEMKSSDKPLGVNLYTEDNPVKAKTQAEYVIDIEIVQHKWQVRRSFNLPFIFFIYRNSFNIAAIFRIYRQGNSHPDFIKSYNVNCGGPKVYQILESNPQDGGLTMPNSRRLALEVKAEDKLIRMLSNDFCNAILKKGG